MIFPAPKLGPSFIALVLLLATLSAQASGEGETNGPQCPPPKSQILRGLTVRTTLGPAVWFGEIGTQSQPGMAFAFGAGYDFFEYLAAEASWTTGFHDTQQARPPAAGSFTTHAFHAGLRFSLPLDRFDLFARGGIGIQWSRPDILVRIQEFDGDSRLAWLGGLGFTWHTPRKHFWIGLEANALGAVDLPGILVMVSAVAGLTIL